MRSCRSSAAARVRQDGIQRPLRPAERPAQPGPLLVVRDGDGDPTVETAELIDVGGPVDVLRCGRRSPIAGPLQQRPVSGVLDDLFRGDIERRVDHRGFDQYALSGAAAGLQRQQQRVDARAHPRSDRRSNTARTGLRSG